MISSWYIVITFLKEFDRGADFWARISGSGADGPNDWFLGGVIDVSEVPRKEEINAVYCRGRNVQRIGFGGRRNAAFRYQLFGQIQHLLVNW